MDGLMTAIVAVLLATTDGRSGALLHALAAHRPDHRRVILLFVLAFVAGAAASAIAGVVADRMLGQGVLTLMLAIGLAGAGVGLLWRWRPAMAAARLGESRGPALAVRLGLHLLGDASQFLILAFAATTGAGHWAFAGGTLGFLLALVPVMALGPAVLERRSVRILRYAAALILLLWAAGAARAAFGV